MTASEHFYSIQKTLHILIRLFSPTKLRAGEKSPDFRNGFPDSGGIGLNVESFGFEQRCRSVRRKNYPVSIR